MINNVIVFSGRKQSGKDWIYKCIKNLYPHAIHRLAFGDELKKVAEYVYDWCDFSDDVKDTPISNGYYSGTKRNVIFTIDKLREIDDTVFFRLWLKNQFVKVVKNPHKLYIITDLRFQHEIDFVKQMKFPIVKFVLEDRSNIMGQEDDKDYEMRIDALKADYEVVNTMTPNFCQDFYDVFDVIVAKQPQIQSILQQR